jgi:hypothetical protein
MKQKVDTHVFTCIFFEEIKWKENVGNTAFSNNAKIYELRTDQLSKKEKI